MRYTFTIEAETNDDDTAESFANVLETIAPYMLDNVVVLSVAVRDN